MEKQTISGKQSEREDELAGQHVDDEYVDTSDDSQWYKGKARDDHRRRMRAAEDRRLGEEDPIQVGISPLSTSTFLSFLFLLFFPLPSPLLPNLILLFFTPSLLMMDFYISGLEIGARQRRSVNARGRAILILVRKIILIAPCAGLGGATGTGTAIGKRKKR